MPDPGRVGDETPRLGVLQPFAGQPRVRPRPPLATTGLMLSGTTTAEHAGEERPGLLAPGDDLLQRHRERQVHEHVPGKARGEHQRLQLAPPAVPRRDQPQIPEIDLQLTARRPVINRRGHLATRRPAPLGREPVQRPLRHHHALPGQQDPDLHHRHAALDPRRDLLAGGPPAPPTPRRARPGAPAGPPTRPARSAHR